jgi:hypothetical protein
VKESDKNDSEAKSMMRLRPRFLVGLLIVFGLIPWLVSLLLPVSGGPISAFKTITRLDLERMGAAIGQDPLSGHADAPIRIDATNVLSTSHHRFTMDSARLGADQTNTNGDLLDAWGTPYRVSVTVQTNFIFRSAGKNGKFGDQDDIIFDSLKKEFVKP